MIDNYSHLCNSNEKENLKSYEPKLNKYGYRCPKCGSRAIWLNGTYKRKTGSFVTIQKYICKKCRHSFKELPYLLANHSHLTIIEYLTIVLHKDKSIRCLSKLLSISRSSIRNIRKGFKQETLKIKSLIILKAPKTLKELYIYFNKANGTYMFSPLSTERARYNSFIPHLL